MVIQSLLCIVRKALEGTDRYINPRTWITSPVLRPTLNLDAAGQIIPEVVQICLESAEGGVSDGDVRIKCWLCGVEWSIRTMGDISDVGWSVRCTYEVIIAGLSFSDTTGQGYSNGETEGKIPG